MGIAPAIAGAILFTKPEYIAVNDPVPLRAKKIPAIPAPVMRTFYLFILAIFLTAAARGQVNLYVDSSVTASGNGTSWTSAYKTFNEALNVANGAGPANPHTIRIAKGTYYPTGLQSGTNRDSTFALLRGGLRVYGGYPNGGGARNVTANPTVLSGAIGSATDSSDNSYHVVVVANLVFNSDSVILDGLSIIRGATATVNTTKVFVTTFVLRSRGAGMYVANAPEKVLINNCRFAYNHSWTMGGGLYGDDVAYTIRDCVFENNVSGTNGGGVWTNTGGMVRVTGCDFSNNRSPIGGGLGATGVELTVSSCTFSNNTALGSSSGGYGGGLYNGANTADASYSNCTFSNNRASRSGGAAYVAAPNGSFGIHSFSNCSFASNNATSLTGGLAEGGALSSGPGLLQVTASAFTGNTVVTPGTTVGGYGGAIYKSGNTCTLTGCSFTSDTANSGGAVYLSTSTYLTAVNDTFIGNYARAFGGAIHGWESTFLNRCVFLSNEAVNGGGAAFLSGSCNVNSCRFQGNRGGSFGGAIRAGSSSSSCSFFSTLFSGNTATNGGALGLGNTGSGASFGNCTFAGNSATAGNSMNAVGTPPMLNCIIWDGVGTSIAGGATPVITHSIVQGGYPGTGNSSASPLFAAPLPSSAAPTSAGDYSVLPCSPAVNTGSNAGNYAGLVDAAGAVRMVGGTVDRGAFEVQNPPAGFLSGPDTICVGGSAQFSNVVTGGVWTSSSPGIAVVNSAGIVTGLSAGTTTISYAVTNSPAGCAGSAIKVVRVSALPTVAAIVGASSVCQGNTTILTNPTPGGVWSSTNTGVATVNAMGAVTGVASGTAIIRYKVTSASGSCADSASQSIAVNPTSLQSASAAICRGANYSFGSLTLSTPGTYTAVFANAAGCDSTVTLTLSNASPDTSVSQTGAQLTALTSGASYQWLRCETDGTKTVLAGQTAPSFTATADGSYAVALTKNGCTDTSSCRAVAVLSVGDIFPHAVTVYPNPTTGLLTVATGATTSHSITVFDLSGRTMQQALPARGSTDLDLRSYAPGVYFLRIVGEAGEQTVRVIVERH